MSSLPIRALVTGGSSGLGLATCLHLLRTKGARVASLDKKESPHSEIRHIKADVTNEGQVKEALAQVEREFEGGLDLLVNCAGVSCAYLTYNHNRQRVHNLDDFRKLLEVNVTGTFNVIRHTCRLLAKPNVVTPLQEDEEGVEGDPLTADDGGSLIVNTGSIAAFDGQIGQVAYAASKGAISSMTLPLSRELASIGVRVCCIAPGPMRTPMLDALSSKAIDTLSRMTPYPKRPGRPEEYAMLVDALYRNHFMNGAVIRLDGALRFHP